jgi:hypothetical protein
MTIPHAIGSNLRTTQGMGISFTSGSKKWSAIMSRIAPKRK